MSIDCEKLAKFMYGTREEWRRHQHRRRDEHQPWTQSTDLVKSDANVATASSPGRNTSTGHMKFDGCMAEIRSTISRVTWRRSVAGHALRRHRIQCLRDEAGGT